MSSFESNNPPDYSIDYIESSIKQFLPNISKNDLKLIHHGTYNVYDVKDKFIFRFPDKTITKEGAWNLINNEKEKLNIIRNNISYPIPEPKFISDDSNNPFVGYKKIPGISLSKVYHKIPFEKRIQLAKQIGEFLSDLHSTKMINSFKDSNFPLSSFANTDLKEIWEKYLDRVKFEFKIDNRLRSISNYLKKLINGFIDDNDNFNFKPCITHQDFDTSNILVKTEDFSLSAVIDFEDCGIGDPAYDFPFIEEGKDFLQSIFHNYTIKKDKNLLIRIEFYYKRMGLPYILYGIDHNKKSMVDYGEKVLKERMSFSLENYW